MLVICICINYI